MHKLTQYITAYHSCFTESKNTVLQVNYLSVCLVFFMSALQNKGSAGEVKWCQVCVLLHTRAGVESQGLLILQRQDLLQQELSSDNVSQTGVILLSKCLNH